MTKDTQSGIIVNVVGRETANVFKLGKIPYEKANGEVVWQMKSRYSRWVLYKPRDRWGLPFKPKERQRDIRQLTLGLWRVRLIGQDTALSRL